MAWFVREKPAMFLTVAFCNLRIIDYFMSVLKSFRLLNMATLFLTSFIYAISFSILLFLSLFLSLSSMTDEPTSTLNYRCLFFYSFFLKTGFMPGGGEPAISI